MTIRGLVDNLPYFRQMYDAVRLVDPLEKRVIAVESEEVFKTNEVCYHFWKTGQVCSNCISIRSHQDNKSYVKLERSGNDVLVVMTVPVEAKEQRVILELLKKAGESEADKWQSSGVDDNLLRLVSELNDRVVRDKLTGLYNRHFIDERLPADLVRATIEGFSTAVLYLDLDRFKEINDRYGHAAGDQVLKEVSGILRDNLRSDDDWAARFGGDEFLVCLHRADQQQAEAVAERIRGAVATHRILLPGADVTVSATVSIGAAATESSALTAAGLVERADRKLYEAKAAGRDRVV